MARAKKKVPSKSKRKPPTGPSNTWALSANRDAVYVAAIGLEGERAMLCLDATQVLRLTSQLLAGAAGMTAVRSMVP